MSTPAIAVHKVFKSFGPTLVLDDVSFELEPGAFLGIIGPNGGGKTVLLKLLLGLLRPDRGEIRVLGTAPEKARGRVGYVPQFVRFDASFPINVMSAVLTGRLRRDRLLRRYKSQDRDRAHEALERVGLVDFEHRQIGELSGGQLQRVMIARATVTDPEILFLDEPTASLDPEVGHNIYELLAKLSKRMTVVIVSHDIGVVSTYITAVACVNQRVFFHPSGDVPKEIVEEAYMCPVHFYPLGPAGRGAGSNGAKDA